MRNNYKLEDYYWAYKDAMIFDAKSLDIPERTKKSLDRWACFGEEQGGFIMSVLKNNLVKAFSKADRENLNSLEDIVRYMYNRLPMNCWGGVKEVEKWEGLKLPNIEYIKLKSNEDIGVLHHGDTVFINIAAHSRGYVKYMYDKIFNIRKNILDYYDIEYFIVTADNEYLFNGIAERPIDSTLGHKDAEVTEYN